MNTKTMEGLVGARTNMNLLNTPFRVYKEARRRGDTAAMERSMGYVNDFSDKAEEYKAEADKGMKEDAEEAREKAKAECEKAIQKRKEEREELERRTEDNRGKDTDAVEISEEGKGLLKDQTGQDSGASGELREGKADMLKAAPAIYTKSGKASQNQSETSVNISVSV